MNARHRRTFRACGHFHNDTAAPNEAAAMKCLQLTLGR